MRNEVLSLNTSDGGGASVATRIADAAAERLSAREGQLEQMEAAMETVQREADQKDAVHRSSLEQLEQKMLGQLQQQMQRAEAALEDAVRCVVCVTCCCV